MCGFVGIFDTRDPRPMETALLERMTDTLAHRGPDGRGIYQAPGVGLGHRRLSIIDLATGQQPMTTPDGVLTVAFNGEIYNFQETRATLIERGYHFITHSDTEVILYAWQEWGAACVDHFRGMFAFALFDRRTQSLFLARDRLGVKPLYYATLADGRVIFGSELKALLVYPGISRALDVQAVEDYFAYGYVPDPRTILTAVRKLPAATTLTLHRDRPVPTPQPYWDISFATRHRGSAADLGAELIERMREAVKLRMIADVPLGAFLSGGVDSSAVVALMAGLSDTPVTTCSIGFDVPGLDESAYAQQMADRYHTHHHSRQVASDDFALIEQLAGMYDEPFADASALPTFRVCQLARQHVTVALSGDGGDEMLAGYRRHRLHGAEERVRACLPLGVRRALFGPLGRIWPKMDWAPQKFRAKTTIQALARSTAEAYFNTVAVTRDAGRKALFTKAFRAALGDYHAGDLYAAAMANAPADDAIGQAQYADMKIWLPGDILTKIDRASMAVGLEAREPLLDHKLMEWCAGLPLDMRVRGNQGKWLLKKALEPMVPHDLLYRPKMGFVTPIAAWFRGPLAQSVRGRLAQSVALDTGWFERRTLQDALETHVSGRQDNSRLLWQFLMFDLSLRHLQEGVGG